MVPTYRVISPLGFNSGNPAPRFEGGKNLLDQDYSISSILPFVSSTINSERDKTSESNYTLAPYTFGENIHSDAASYHENNSYFDKLPFEIRLKIACDLNQYDSYNLMRVNKSFFESTIVRLYHTIIIDPSYSQFNQELHQTLNSKYGQLCTFIKMKYSLKNFLKIIGQVIPMNSGSSGPFVHYGQLINRLEFVDLPDGFNAPFDLNFFAFMSIKRLDRISKFFWGSNEELSLELVTRIPNKDNLNSLHVSVDFKKLRAPHEFDAFRGFHNLDKLSIEPFLDSYILFQIFKNLLDGNNGVLGLKTLKLAKLNSNHNFIKNLPSSALVLTNHMLEHEPIKLSDYDLNCMLNLFILFSAADSRMEELKTLSLDSMVMTTADCKRLNSILDLSNLTQLELRNITEVQFPEDINSPLTMNELHTRLDGGFLKSLGKKLKSLKRLSIDYRESLRDTVPAFIHSLDTLEELDVTIRWNVTKLCSIQSWKHLCFMYTRAILKHFATLKKLSLDTKEDSVFCDLHKLIFTDCLLEFGDLKELISLRLHGYSLQPCAPVLVSALPNLRYFELFGSGAGGAPHMGLQVVHHGVLDDWLRVQHVAVAINEANKNIDYIKIDKCIFEVQDKSILTPRDGLDGWFNRKVRVTLDRDDF